MRGPTPRRGPLAAVLSVAVAFSWWTAPFANAAKRDEAAPLVLLVRHAEKASEEGDDPNLTADGAQRAKDLAAALRDAGVTAIITTQLRRTTETAQPLAAALGIKPEIVPLDWQKLPANIKAVAAAVRRHPGGAVLVVGHQNTVPEIIEALGGPHLANICDPVYDNLFVLVPGPSGPRLIRSRYGAASPDPGPGCK